MNQHEQLQQAAKFALEVLLWTQAGEPVPSMEREAIKQLKTALGFAVHCMDEDAPVQEPVAWMNGWGDLFKHPDAAERKQTLRPLYTQPPQRKPLTEEEIDAIPCTDGDGSDWDALVRFARQIEQHHGIV